MKLFEDVDVTWGDRRSPRGERGLKFIFTGNVRVQLMSLPSRGAWIEIEIG